MNQGDRLAFSNGILVLSAFAAILIVAFGGDTQSLLPLYMIGVFLSFTLSQAGMVIHWRTTRSPGGKPARSSTVSAPSSPASCCSSSRSRRRRGRVDRAAADSADRDGLQGDAPPLRARRVRADVEGYEPQPRVHNTVLIPIGGLQRAVVEALRYAETLSDDVRAIYVDVNPAQHGTVCGKTGRRWGGSVKLVVLPSPYPIADGAAARVHRAGPPTNSPTIT